VETFAPTIKTRDGKVIAPTGNEWIFYLACSGCEWALDHLKDKKIIFVAEKSENGRGWSDD
jgi:hypothetical protein